MLTLRNLGIVATKSGRSKLLAFAQCQTVINPLEQSVPVVDTSLLRVQLVRSLQTTPVNLRRSCIRDLKIDYNWKRERPFGPHRHQPPNRRNHRAAENYHHIIHYPKDAVYTIKKLNGECHFQLSMIIPA